LHSKQFIDKNKELPFNQPKRLSALKKLFTLPVGVGNQLWEYMHASSWLHQCQQYV